MTRNEVEANLIADFQMLDESVIYLHPQTEEVAQITNAVGDPELWKKWVDSSGKDAPPPDFYSDELGLMMEVMRIDDHGYRKKGKTVNPVYEKERQLERELRATGILDSFPNIELVVTAKSDLPTEEDHNYSRYVANFRGAIEKHGKKIFALVSNRSLAVERRDLLKQFDCFICNKQEAGMFFFDDYMDKSREEMRDILAEKVKQAQIPAMVVTLGGDGAVYADLAGTKGHCPAIEVQVKDTTGAGDAFCAGVSIGLTYGKSLPEAIDIGSQLAASVITSSENVCPRFLPRELGIDIDAQH